MYSKITSLFLIMFTIFVSSIRPNEARAAYAPVAPTLTIGGRQFVDLTNLIVVSCYIGAGDSCTLRKNNSGSGYQVTAGKTFVATAIEFHNSTTTGTGQVIPVYSDNDIGFAAAAGSFTNPVYFNGATVSTVLFNLQAVSSSGNNGVTAFSFLWQVPATKFPGIRMPSSVLNLGIFVYGYEQ